MNNKKGRKEVEGLEHLGFVFEYNGQPISMDKPGNGSKQGNYKGTVYLEKEAVQQVFSLSCKRDYTHDDIWDPVNGAIVEGTRQRLADGECTQEDLGRGIVCLRQSLSWRKKGKLNSGHQYIVDQVEHCIYELEGMLLRC